jgi:hypothetical protein
MSMSVSASTTVEYKATCRYVDSNKKERYAGPCQGNFGLTSADPKTPMRYLMTFPNKSEITVFVYSNGLASVNGIPAKHISSSKGIIKLITGEDEEFHFSTPPRDSM